MITYIDAATGERSEARSMGDPVAFISELQDFVRKGQTDAGAVRAVPCGGCVACCYHTKVPVNPAEEKPEDFAHLSCRVTEDGTLALDKQADGACVHLTESGCGVYEHRPRVCRGYDCRIAAMCCMVEPFDGGHCSPKWVFEPRPGDKMGSAVMSALLLLAPVAMLRARGQDGGGAMTVEDVLPFVMAELPQAVEAVRSLLALPLEKRMAILGVDENSFTPESMRAAFSRAFPGLKTA